MSGPLHQPVTKNKYETPNVSQSLLLFLQFEKRKDSLVCSLFKLRQQQKILAYIWSFFDTGWCNERNVYFTVAAPAAKNQHFSPSKKTKHQMLQLLYVSIISWVQFCVNNWLFTRIFRGFLSYLQKLTKCSQNFFACHSLNFHVPSSTLS